VELPQLEHAVWEASVLILQSNYVEHLVAIGKGLFQVVSLHAVQRTWARAAWGDIVSICREISVIY
jgi:hypothetical protein